MERNGICVAGNMIVDILYPIERWPKQSELTTITEGISRATGGALCNVIVDLAKLDPDLPLKAIGVIGSDSEGDFISAQLGAHPNIDMSGVVRQGSTSFTAVMSNNETKQRTFFQYRGANALFCEDHIDWDAIPSKLLHIGYILLLDALDQPDDEYGTKMARLLAHAQAHGIKTSIDVVSEASDRFVRLVTPALRYTDYCVINELEAQQTTGIILRDEDETLHPENIRAALEKMFELGVSTWAVIHCPEGGWGLDKDGNFVEEPSIPLPKGYVKGKVGAGDAFCSGVIYAAHQGLSLKEGIALGTATAVISLRAPGASEGLCPVQEVNELYAGLCAQAAQ